MEINKTFQAVFRHFEQQWQMLCNFKEKKISL